MKHRNFLLEVTAEGMGWDCAGLLVAEPRPKQAGEVMALAKEPAAEVKESRAGGSEAIRTLPFFPQLNSFSIAGEPSPSSKRQVLFLAG